MRPAPVWPVPRPECGSGATCEGLESPGRRSDLILPNFFILGIQKAGTTTLYEVLARHPDVFFPFHKETYFFSNEDIYRNGIDFYSNEYFKDSEDYTVRGEATPFYLTSDDAAARICQHLGHLSPKFVVILRNPVQRAYSAYWHSVRRQREHLSFEDAIKQESSRVAALRAAGKRWWRDFAYVENGRYARQLESYWRLFPRERFCILLTEDLRDDPGRQFKRILDFLDLKEAAQLDVRARGNTSVQPRLRLLERMRAADAPLLHAVRRAMPHLVRGALRRQLHRVNMKRFEPPPMSEATASYLLQTYRRDNERLMELLDRDLSHWNTA